MGVIELKIPNIPELPIITHDISDQVIPESFDSRVQWPHCKTVSEIRDQGSCGSCWAFGAAEALSDRFCIASNGKINVELSPDDLLTCCSYCGFGCHGGVPSMAWRFFEYSGVVSGGLYGTHQTCRPYEFPACEHHMSGPRPACTKPGKTPKCVHTCDKSFNRTYSEDKYHSMSAYSVANHISQIQIEILKNGPVEASMKVYSDFVHYRSG